MKKILVLSLCFVLALWMAGCVQNKNINFGDVTMKVVEGSVTPSGLTVRISNNTGIDINGGINYDFSIEKKEDDKWSPVKEIGDRTTDTETYIFQGERDLNINWSEIYGSLSAGEYRVVKFFIHRQKMALMVQTMVFTYSLSSVSSNKYEFYRGAATSVGAVNGRDERRTSAPPLTAPPGLALRLSRRASPRGACPPPLILGGGQ